MAKIIDKAKEALMNGVPYATLIDILAIEVGTVKACLIASIANKEIKEVV